MKFDVWRYKFIFAGILGAALVFAGLFGFTRLELLKLQKETATPPPEYLREEEAVVIEPKTEEEEPEVIPIQVPLFQYIEVVESCGPYFDGPCLNARSGPGRDFPIVARLRRGMVLKVAGQVERDGILWFKVVFDERLRYPERVGSDWFVAGDYVRPLTNEGIKVLQAGEKESPNKRIVISRKEQKLYAYEGEELFLETAISTGLELTPTPRGIFTIYRKTPTRYMQGPIPGIVEKYYDLPGVPWNLYFTHQGAVIHGAYWHDNFGRPQSAGCVNVAPSIAEKLYYWADLGTKVIVE